MTNISSTRLKFYVPWETMASLVSFLGCKRIRNMSIFTYILFSQIAFIINVTDKKVKVRGFDEDELASSYL